MNFLLLACKIEYERAALRLEELAHAEPGTMEARERKELLSLFIQFERETNKLYLNKPSQR